MRQVEERTDFGNGFIIRNFGVANGDSSTTGAGTNDNASC